MADFRFLVCPVLSTTPFGELDLTNVQFTQSVDGTGTTLTAQAALSPTQSASKLKDYLNYPNDPKAIALYVKSDDQYLWGGVLQARPWNRDAHAFDIIATSWKAWLYQRYMNPNVGVNPVVDFKYSWTAQDQFKISQDIITYATAVGGTPDITIGTETSGVTRDLNIFGSEFIYAGEAIDRMANREKGFEWEVEIRSDNSGHPLLRFIPYYPKKAGLNAGVLFKSTPEGGNIVSYSNPDDSAETTVTRVWGSGSGTAGTDLLMAYDSDPGLDTGNVLLVESKEYANSTTTGIATIASHVQGIRKFHSSGLQQITVTIPLDSPRFQDYNTGDKIRLIVRDEIQEIDFDTVRIVRRTFNVNASGDAPALDSVTCLIDLNDTALPQNEEAL